jgi:hypothetical protein
MGTSHKDQCTFMIISRSVLLRIRKGSDENFTGNQNTHFIFNNVFFFENRAVYEIMWKKYRTEADRPQMIIRRMRISCWIRKATKTPSEYVIIIAFTQ